jgi:RNA-binding protein
MPERTKTPAAPSGVAPTTTAAPAPAKPAETSGRPTRAEVRGLRARAQRLDALLKLGKSGVTDAWISSLDLALSQHGLVKIKFVDFKDERHTIAPQLAERTHSHLVWEIGNVAVYYRKQETPPDADEPGGLD